MVKYKDSSKQRVLERAKEENVEFFRVQFIDVLGQPKNCALTVKHLEDALDNGVPFDGSSIAGFQEIHVSDLVAMPDPDTFIILPWRERGRVISRLICDITHPDGKPYQGDPRTVLRNVQETAAKKGYDNFSVGPEIEFFLFKEDGNDTPSFHDTGKYFDLAPMDDATEVRKEIMLRLEQVGIDTETSHHEVAESQHEINLKYNDALKMADTLITYKHIAMNTAKQHDLFVSYMPKPVEGINGSGMHVHQSLWKGNKNMFYDASDELQMSDTARHYIGGLMKNADAMVAITNPTVNSYKRLVPGYEAPNLIAWGARNRSAFIRVPATDPKNQAAKRIELRCPDPSTNPYLAFATMLACGLDGVINKTEPTGRNEDNLYKYSAQDFARKGIRSLPASLEEAIGHLKESKVIRKALGEHVFNQFISLKEAEWDSYRVQVTPWEVKQYLRSF